MDYVGIDLGCSAVGHAPSSAVAILNGNGKLRDEPQHFRQAGELAEAVSQCDREQIIIAVDAPRSVPDHTRENYAYRSCERAVKAVDKYAGSFAGAAALFLRWHDIEAKYFKGLKVIETYPRVAWFGLGFPGKPKDFAKNRRGVWAAMGSLIGASCKGFSRHQVDAALCAYTAWCYGNEKADWYGEPGEGLIFIPAVSTGRPVPPGAEHIDERFRRFPSMA